MQKFELCYTLHLNFFLELFPLSAASFFAHRFFSPRIIHPAPKKEFPPVTLFGQKKSGSPQKAFRFNRG
ncbi:MAG: hypothetical protein U1C58_13885 [Flavobacteriaceae bacterium]|nr:hypothetical protein [Flavobacteriaceae bacterium]MDZ4149371.1 hypothetical protein [Flavobacteriaceae bacterium]